MSETQDYANYKRVTVNGRLLCDLELLVTGAFSPLDGFLKEADYNSVVENVRLTTGEVWPMPIVYRIPQEKESFYRENEKVVLTDQTNLPIAILHVEEIYKPDLHKECKLAYGTTDTNHPFVKEVLSNTAILHIGGRVESIQSPLHFDFSELRMTPEKVKSEIKKRGWTRVVGFQTRNPMHRSHQQLTLRARRELIAEDGATGNTTGILIHPVVGVTQACDVNYHTRVKCYKQLLNHYEKNTCMLSLIPLSMRMAGPREALWHALIRKNYGCTHFIVGRDHAGPSYKTKEGESFYGPYDSHQMVEKYGPEIGIKVIMSKAIVYVKETQVYMALDEVPSNHTVESISGTQQRQMLQNGEEIPSWFTYPEIADTLRVDYPSNNQKGFCIYLVGLSGSGKSTLASAVFSHLQEKLPGRKISILDGDIVRQNLSKGLGFSREDRSVNVRRIGYVASEIVKHGGICLSANIAPYQEDRDANRALISPHGAYVEVFVDTPLEVCEARDCKGLYKLAREGKIKEFTGISDPFEKPTQPEVTINSTGISDMHYGVEQIYKYLSDQGFVPRDS
jgi:sulfate adenylyltransferase